MFYRLSGYVIPITNMVKKHISSRCFVNLMISTPLLCIQSGTLVYPGTRPMLHIVALLKFDRYNLKEHFAIMFVPKINHIASYLLVKCYQSNQTAKISEVKNFHLTT